MREQPAQEQQHRAARVGIGGANGSGKTRLLEQLLPRLCTRGIEFAIITDGAEKPSDALQTQERPASRVSSTSTTSTTSAHAEIDRMFSGLELMLIENDLDDSARSAVTELDHRLFVLDVVAGDRMPQQIAVGAITADVLILNKIDLAAYGGADLPRLLRDFAALRSGKPILLTSCATGQGVAAVVEHLVGLL